MDEFAEKRRRQRIEIRSRLAQDVARDEFRRVLVHVDEAVQLLQDVVRDVPRRPRLTVQEHGDFGIAKPDFLDEPAQIGENGARFLRRAAAELLVVDRQDERRGARLLLREAGEIAVARYAEYLRALCLDRACERANAESAGVLRAVVLVDDDDGKAKFHPYLQTQVARMRAPGANCAPSRRVSAEENSASGRTPS